MQMEPGVEKGRVVHFDSRDSKRYGFIHLDSGEEIFFHYNDGRIAADGGWSGLCWDMPNRSSNTVLDYPNVGDTVYFIRSPGKKGPKASPWTAEEYYLQAVENRWCPCGHHILDHEHYGFCLKCGCPDFGTSPDEWETLTEVSFTEGPMGHKGYE